MKNDERNRISLIILIILQNGLSLAINLSINLMIK